MIKLIELFLGLLNGASKWVKNLSVLIILVLAMLVFFLQNQIVLCHNLVEFRFRSYQILRQINDMAGNKENPLLVVVVKKDKIVKIAYVSDLLNSLGILPNDIIYDFSPDYRLEIEHKCVVSKQVGHLVGELDNIHFLKIPVVVNKEYIGAIVLKTNKSKEDLLAKCNSFKSLLYSISSDLKLIRDRKT